MEHKTALLELIGQHIDHSNDDASDASQGEHWYNIDLSTEVLSNMVSCLHDKVDSSSMDDMSKERSGDWEILANISAELKKAEKSEELATVFLKEIYIQTKCQYGTFYKLNRSHESLEFWQAYPNQDSEGNAAPIDSKFLFMLVDKDEPYYINRSALHLKHRQLLVETETDTDVNALLLPMTTSQGEHFGMLLVGLEPHKRLDSGQLATLHAIVGMAADVLNRASMMQTLENLVAERTKELTTANERLLELDQLKTKFIQDISHEFRTPLTSIGLYLSLLEKEVDEKGNRYIDVLKRQTDQLTRLINAILDISDQDRMMGGGVFGMVNLKALLLETIALKESYAITQNLALSANVEDDVRIYGNPEALRRLISNLIDNAISYTSEGKINVSLTQVDGYAHIQITDTGIGIPEPELEHIFDRFYRGVNVSQLDIPGSGLGLSMVKQIVEQHDGRIEVESKLEMGTTFSVWLPLLKA